MGAKGFPGNKLFTFFALETYASTIRDKPILVFIAIFIEVRKTVETFVIWHVL